MSLKQLGGENITVSSTAIGPTSSEVTDEVMMAEFQLLSGGALHCQTKTTPTAVGITGDFRYGPGAIWRVWGHDEIKDFLMIALTVNALVAVQFYGTGKT